MAGDRSEADVFAIPDFWKTSQWLDQLTKDTSTSLFGHGLDAVFCNDEPSLLPLAPISIDADGFFKLPQLKDAAEPNEQQSTDVSDEAGSVSQGPTDLEAQSDVWTSTELPPKPAAFRTWETFNTGRPVPHTSLFLSEAGAGAYDALLSWPTDSLDLANTGVPVVATRPYFSSILALSLGRESVLFAKDAESETFRGTLSEFRVSGYTRQVLEGVEKQALQCGSTYSYLCTFTRSLYASPSSRCAVALASAVNQILQAVEYRVTVDGRFPRSLLQLQSSVKEASAILRPLKDLAARLPPAFSDEDILSLVFQEASSLEFSENYIRDMLCEILQRVSTPWVESIEEWLGTRREAGMPFTKLSIGERKGFVKVDVEVFTDDFGREVEDVDFRLDTNKVPQFLPADVAESIFETGRNLRFIREFHPNHLLSQPGGLISNQPPKAEWLFDWDSILHVGKRIEQYQNSMLQAIQQRRLDSAYRSMPPNLSMNGPPPPKFELDLFGVDQCLMEKRLLDSIHQLNQPFTAESDSNALSRLVRARLSGIDEVENNAAPSDDMPHWSLVPILSFGGIASCQAQIVNRESLRLLFEAHDVQTHLGLQRDFHLLRNGLFCSRLTHALFDSELESAERHAGVAMQGGIMGLRLGGRDTWPPASSELRLALMGVLSEAYETQISGESSKSTNTGPGSSTLPGDLSFAVRDLSEEEIDRCMDPDTLEALDFLRLSYTTPPELTSIITPIHLMHYDRIFKLLLRTLRMLYVVNQLYRDTNSRLKTWYEDDASYRFVRESQHFVSSIASYFLDSGVAIPWQMFERKLASIRVELNRHDLSSDDRATCSSPSQVRDMHSLVLDRLMFALFLRKRQQPVLKLLEEIFAIILVYAKHSRLQALGRSNEAAWKVEPPKLYAEFKKKLQVFITVCRGLSEKARVSNKRPTEGITFEDFGIGDDSLIAQLLTKLDIEIDHNFSKAHRIVTSSIIPVVEQYGEHSRAVWEASKFWKQFFEASANVSLSGYEELANDDESTTMEESTAMRDETTTDYAPSEEDLTATPVARDTTMHGDESLLDDAELSGSTPRLPVTKTISNGTPLDNMRGEIRNEEEDTTVLQDGDEDSTVLFAQRTAQLPDMSMTPRGSREDHAAEQEHSARRSKDPLLHRVLDKNYRVQATPHRHGVRVSPLKRDHGKKKEKEKGKASWQEDDSFMSSPEMAPPTLRSEVFMSPYKLMARQRAAAAASQGPRTPGVSVQTPAMGKKSRDVLASTGTGRGRATSSAGISGEAAVGPSAGEAASRGRQKYEIDWESDDDGDDDDLYAGMSPPKTIQFALPPSKLLRTPAREASRRIVDDILIDAGADPESSEYSPTMVKMNEDILNDSF
ncbi:hypothetical protein QQS21_003477 [Conoideocrella luteorostrata]|uniref:DASH complex subunit ASK1 n=1 Tax=Conoideocrella luteorostrata TaxID=1105319 RepID=A0AAJ0CT50_9HYPO|nr:hypothetical protein QQS21_003477 [Conoideocrella luteorostrata]